MVNASNSEVVFCSRCIMPSTQDGQDYDDFGVCNVCRSSEDKMRIDWSKRRNDLEIILKQAKERHKNDPYDCLIPISGGKDSVFQLHVLVKEFSMRPLAVTFSHNWYTSVGMYNLVNCLEKFDVDHVMFTPKRTQVNSLAKKSLYQIGDACWHCHAGIGAYPLKVAKDYGIKLLIWGESVSESSSRGTYSNPTITFDQDYFLKVSAKVGLESMLGPGEQPSTLNAYATPSADEYANENISGIHLGDYIFWDEEKQTEFVEREYGWIQHEVEGTYKNYKSVECIMPGVHDFACYMKRGYGRATFHASNDIRNGLITRDEGLEISKEFDQQFPEVFSYYSSITGINEEEFIEILEGQKHKSLKGVPLPIQKKTSVNPPTLFVEDLKTWVSSKFKSEK